MTLQLNGLMERVEPYALFEGRVVDLMPRLISGRNEKGEVVDVPRTPISYADIIDRRETAPEDVREAWQNEYVFTGDADLCDDKGANLIALDAQLLRELNGKSQLYQRAAVLSQSCWNELAAKRDVLILSPEEVEEADGKGYVKKEGVWVPANPIVGKVWEGTDTFPGLARGRNLTSYIQLVEENSPHNSESLLNVYFNHTRQEGSVSGRSLVAVSIDDSSSAGGRGNLDFDSGRLFGVAPEAHVAREKMLDARVSAAHIAGRAYELGEHLWVPVPKTAGIKL